MKKGFNEAAKERIQRAGTKPGSKTAKTGFDRKVQSIVDSKHASAKSKK